MTLCPDDELQKLVSSLEGSTGGDVADIDAAISSYPSDARLVFMKGSLLAGSGDLVGAHAHLSKAVEMDPDFAIARFQLGFFQLTSGESNAALKTWARLDMLPEGHYLKLFAQGLRHLIRDEFQACITNIEEGISLNDENLPLNNDMTLILERTKPLLENEPVEPVQDETTEASATSILLNQFGDESTKH